MLETEDGHLPQFSSFLANFTFAPSTVCYSLNFLITALQNAFKDFAVFAIPVANL